jgi:hypothetical protein
MQERVSRIRRWKEGAMAELQLHLTAEERDYLVSVLETALKDTRVEEHRTRSPSYREHIVRHEELIAALLSKLGKSV